VPVNVLYLVRTWAFGGSHTIILLLMEHLPKDRYNVICVPYDTFSGTDAQFVEQAHRRGLEIAPDRIPWKSRTDWWKARQTVRDLIEKYQVDFVHAHDPQSTILVGLGRDTWGCARVATEYGWWSRLRPFRRTLNQWIERQFALPRFDLVITVADDMKRRILRGPTPETRVRVIKTGLKPADPPGSGLRETVRRRLGIPIEACVVGTVSRVSVEKGHDVLLDAAARLAPDHPRLHVLIVGRGPARRNLERRTAELGISDRVTFAGFLQDLAAAHAAMDVFVQPSVEQEGLPTSVLEAQLSGLPVVASDIGGVNEALCNGVTGHLAPPGDASALAKVLATLIKDASRRKDLGDAGRAWVADRFSISRMIEETCDAYEEALATYHARQRGSHADRD
jgi:glycosyltransferase involved in cell wall biosynthesis